MRARKSLTQMLQPKHVSVFGALAVIALAAGAGPAKATIIFGTLAGQTTGCAAASLAGDPNTSASTALTLKQNPPFTAGEDGLGENATPPPPAVCTDPDCEIGTPTSVKVVSTGPEAITDAIIGSVQSGETFEFFVQN